jgi:transcriptional coactivator HFI1/ADA1
MPPIAYSDGALPSSHQLSLRLSQLAKAYDLTVAPETTTEIGEFLAVGMDSHVADVITSLVRLTGHDRRGVDTIHIPDAKSIDTDGSPPDHDQTPKTVTIVKEADELPKPDIDAMKYLFNLVPELHTQASPSVYKLLSSQSKHELEVEVKTEAFSPLALNATPGRNGHGPHLSPIKSTLGLSAGSTAEMKRERLAHSELLKLDHGKEGDGKKHQKHNLHWKYEDPAVVFQDLLG